MQLETLRSWSKENHAVIVGEYIDAGLSARKPAQKRPELQRLLSDVRSGCIDLIIFVKLDRWFRNIADYYKTQEILDANHVNWKAIAEDYETETTSGRFKVNIMLAVAQDEADRTSERIRAVFDNKRDKGQWVTGKLPFGFKVENKRLVPDEETAPIVREIFDHYIVSRSARETARWLLGEHHIEYSHYGMNLLLHSKVYSEKNIVDAETFNRVQDIFAQNTPERHASKRTYLFTGLLICKECGGRMIVSSNESGAYYRCRRHTETTPCKHHHYHNETKIEAALLETLVSEAEKYNIELSEKRKERKTPDVAGIKRKMDKLKDLYLNDMIDRDAYAADYSALREKLEITALPPSEAPIDIKHLQSVLALYSELTRPQKKEFWAKTVKKSPYLHII
ncbi:MAG: recombinase family protein [Oscillospiraceae bacterium]|nr:recombinase family protein [Oscillospiraceae bacterium]